jgi:hypothetical protein
MQVESDIMLEDETKTCHPQCSTSSHHNMHVLHFGGLWLRRGCRVGRTGDGFGTGRTGQSADAKLSRRLLLNSIGTCTRAQIQLNASLLHH